MKTYRNHEQILIDECRNDSLRVEQESAELQRGKLCDENSQLNKRIEHLRREIRAAEDVVNSRDIYPGYEGKRMEAGHDIKVWNQEIGKLQKQIVELDERIAGYDKQITKIKQKKLRDL